MPFWEIMISSAFANLHSALRGLDHPESTDEEKEHFREVVEEMREAIKVWLNDPEMAPTVKAYIKRWETKTRYNVIED